MADTPLLELAENSLQNLLREVFCHLVLGYRSLYTCLEMAGDVGLDLVAESATAEGAGDDVCVGVVEHGADAAGVQRARQIRVAVTHRSSTVTDGNYFDNSMTSVTVY